MMKRKLVLAASLLAAGIAHAEVAVIVNPASPAASLSAGDAANIFLGKASAPSSTAFLAAAAAAALAGLPA